jgi:hypothetical protein
MRSPRRATSKGVPQRVADQPNNPRPEAGGFAGEGIPEVATQPNNPRPEVGGLPSREPQNQGLRSQLEHPVYLFDLVPTFERIMESAEPHVCREDLYSARMECDQAAVHVCWTIIGPTKDEKISYSYK